MATKDFDSKENLWKIREEFTDVTITCLENKTISAHKIILSASSHVLHQLCYVSSEICLSESPLATVHSLLEFIYTGRVPANDASDATDGDLYNDFCRLAKNLEVTGLSPTAHEKTETSSKRKSHFEAQLVSKKFRPTPDDSESPSTNIFSLPSEILLKIFSYLTTRELVASLPLVSKQFNELVKSPEVHTAFHWQSGKTPISEELKRFLEGKNQIRNIQLYFSSFKNLATLLDLTMTQQKMTRIVDIRFDFELVMGYNTPNVLELIKQQPGKAEQIKQLTIHFPKAGSGPVMVDLPNLVELRLEGGLRSDYVFQMATHPKKLQSLTSKRSTNQSDFFVPFVEAQQNSLTKLILTTYECNDADFVSLSSVCKKLQVMDLNCKRVTLKNLLKIANLKNLSDLTIYVSLNCFRPEFLSVCLEELPIKDLFVDPSHCQHFCVSDRTRLRLTLLHNLSPDISLFFVNTEFESLRLKYDAQIDDLSVFERFENLTELRLDLPEKNLSSSNILDFLSMAKRMNLQKFEMRFSKSSLSYESNAFTLKLFHKSVRPEILSKILTELENFHPEKLSLTYSGAMLNSHACSIGLLQDLKEVYLSFANYYLLKERTAKQVFESLTQLESLIFDFPDKIWSNLLHWSDGTTWHLPNLKYFQNDGSYSAKFIFSSVFKAWLKGKELTVRSDATFEEIIKAFGHSTCFRTISKKDVTITKEFSLSKCYTSQFCQTGVSDRYKYYYIQ